MAHPRTARPAHSDALGRYQAQVNRLGLGSAFAVCGKCKKLKNTGVLIGGCTCPPEPINDGSHKLSR